MADVIAYGFGALPPTNLLGSAGNVGSNVIQSAPGRKVALRTILPTAIQIAGALMAASEIGISVLRCPSAIQDIPTRQPATNVPVNGIVTIPPTGCVLVAVATYRIGVDMNDIKFDVNDCTAQDGDKLIILVSPLIDVSAMPHLVTDNGLISITTAGDNLQSQGSSDLNIWQYGGKPASARSMPRWDVPGTQGGFPRTTR